MPTLSSMTPSIRRTVLRLRQSNSQPVMIGSKPATDETLPNALEIGMPPTEVSVWY